MTTNATTLFGGEPLPSNQGELAHFYVYIVHKKFFGYVPPPMAKSRPEYGSVDLPLKEYSLEEVKNKVLQAFDNQVFIDDSISPSTNLLIVPDRWDRRLPDSARPYAKNLAYLPFSFVLHPTVKNPDNILQLMVPKDAAYRVLLKENKIEVSTNSTFKLDKVAPDKTIFDHLRTFQFTTYPRQQQQQQQQQQRLFQALTPSMSHRSSTRKQSSKQASTMNMQTMIDSANQNIAKAEKESQKARIELQKAQEKVQASKAQAQKSINEAQSTVSTAKQQLGSIKWNATDKTMYPSSSYPRKRSSIKKKSSFTARAENMASSNQQQEWHLGKMSTTWNAANDDMKASSRKVPSSKQEWHLGKLSTTWNAANKDMRVLSSSRKALPSRQQESHLGKMSTTWNAANTGIKTSTPRKPDQKQQDKEYQEAWAKLVARTNQSKNHI